MAPIPSGTRVVVHGLQSKPEWNGFAAIVTGFSPAKNRHNVEIQLPGQPASSAWLKPSSLQVAPEAEQPQRYSPGVMKDVALELMAASDEALLARMGDPLALSVASDVLASNVLPGGAERLIALLERGLLDVLLVPLEGDAHAPVPLPDWAAGVAIPVPGVDGCPSQLQSVMCMPPAEAMEGCTSKECLRFTQEEVERREQRAVEERLRRLQPSMGILINLACTHFPVMLSPDVQGHARLAIAKRLKPLCVIVDDAERMLWGSRRAHLVLCRHVRILLGNVLLSGQGVPPRAREQLHGALGTVLLLRVVLDGLFAGAPTLRDRYGSEADVAEPPDVSTFGFPRFGTITVQTVDGKSLAADWEMVALSNRAHALSALNELVDVDLGALPAHSATLAAIVDVANSGVNSTVLDDGGGSTLADDFNMIVLEIVKSGRKYAKVGTLFGTWDELGFVHGQLIMGLGSTQRAGGGVRFDSAEIEGKEVADLEEAEGGSGGQRRAAKLGGSTAVRTLVAALSIRQNAGRDRALALHQRSTDVALLSMIKPTALDGFGVPCDKGTARLVDLGVLECACMSASHCMLCSGDVSGKRCARGKCAFNVPVVEQATGLFDVVSSCCLQRQTGQALALKIGELQDAHIEMEPFAALRPLRAKIGDMLSAMVQSSANPLGHAQGRSEMYGCYFCHKKLRKLDMMTCGACKMVFYCSKECQRKDWKVGKPPHDIACKTMQASKASLHEGLSEKQVRKAENDGANLSSNGNALIQSRMLVIACLVDVLKLSESSYLCRGQPTPQIRDLVILLDMTRIPAVLLPIPIDVFLGGDQGERCTYIREFFEFDPPIGKSLDRHTRDVINRNRGAESPFFTCICVGNRDRPGDFTILSKSMPVDAFELAHFAYSTSDRARLSEMLGSAADLKEFATQAITRGELSFGGVQM